MQLRRWPGMASNSLDTARGHCQQLSYMRTDFTTAASEGEKSGWRQTCQSAIKGWLQALCGVQLLYDLLLQVWLLLLQMDVTDLYCFSSSSRPLFKVKFLVV